VVAPYTAPHSTEILDNPPAQLRSSLPFRSHQLVFLVSSRDLNLCYVNGGRQTNPPLRYPSRDKALPFFGLTNHWFPLYNKAGYETLDESDA